LPLFKSVPTKCDPQFKAFPSNPWLASSALQKAIRRGDVDVASAAADVLFRLRGSSIWSRFMTIAFEDIGAADPETICQVVRACSDPRWRRQAGENAHVVQQLAKHMALAGKDRSADHLICCARSHPSLADVRAIVANCSISQRIEMAAIQTPTITQRAVASWFSSGVEWGDEKRVGPGDLDALLDAFHAAGVPAALLEATNIGARRTREPIVIMLPVLWLAVNGDAAKIIKECPVPQSPLIEGVPAYALDMHTRIGRRAIDIFVKECPQVSALLRECASTFRSRAACLAAFYVDGAPIARRLSWVHSDDLEKIGIENDFLSVGVAPNAIPDLLAAFGDHLDHLNAIRARVLTSTLRS
jgi:hypothetical protein